MPLYEYQCEACGTRFELIRKFSDPPLETCVKCGATGKIHKLVSSPAFHLKGSDWYATDYAKKSGDSGASAGKSEGKSDGKSDAKTDAKPEAAKESTAPAADKPAASAAPATTSASKDK